MDKADSLQKLGTHVHISVVDDEKRMGFFSSSFFLLKGEIGSTTGSEKSGCTHTPSFQRSAEELTDGSQEKN